MVENDEKKEELKKWLEEMLNNHFSDINARINIIEYRLDTLNSNMIRLEAKLTQPKILSFDDAINLIKERRVVFMNELRAKFSTFTRGEYKTKFKEYARKFGIVTVRLPIHNHPEVCIYIGDDPDLEYVFSEKVWKTFETRGGILLDNLPDNQRRRIVRFFREHFLQHFDITDFSIHTKIKRRHV